MLDRIKASLLFSLFFFVSISPASAIETAIGDPSQEPVYVVIMNHVEGDRACRPKDVACLTSLAYQTAVLPPPGVGASASYSLDIAGNDLIYDILTNYHDSPGRGPKLFIEPAGEWWETYSDPYFGGKAFNRHDYLALGNEFGLQGHAIYFSGKKFGWYGSPHTPKGISWKFRDLHRFAELAGYEGRKINSGETYTGGWKLENAYLGDGPAEYLIDHEAFALGYHVSIEDHDGHIEDQPADIDPLHPRPSFYVYRAVYNDGVGIVKLDMNGSVTGRCAGATPRCETPAEAVQRFDRTLAERSLDSDAGKVYFFAFVVHSGGVWNDFNMAAAGYPLLGEGLGLTTIMDHIQSRINEGAAVQFVTPSELAGVFEEKNPSPHYFIAVHNEPVIADLEINYLALKKLVDKANGYGMKLTLMFTPPWADYIMNDPSRAQELSIWKAQGHEIAGHHHAVHHPGTWDGYTYLSEAEAAAIRNSMGKNEPYFGDLVAFTAELEKLNPDIHSGCMNDEGDKNELPQKIAYDTCSGYANFGVPGARLHDGVPEKGKNEFISVGTVNGIERKWLTHFTIFDDAAVKNAQRAYGTMTSGVYGTVTHSVANQSDEMIKFMDYLHTLDPTGKRSRTVSEIIDSGMLPEIRIIP